MCRLGITVLGINGGKLFEVMHSEPLRKLLSKYSTSFVHVSVLMRQYGLYESSTSFLLSLLIHPRHIHPRDELPRFFSDLVKVNIMVVVFMFARNQRLK